MKFVKQSIKSWSHSNSHPSFVLIKTKEKQTKWATKIRTTKQILAKTRVKTQNSRLWVDQGRVESEPELLQWLCHRKNQLWQMFHNCKRGVWQGGGGSIIDQTSATITHQAAFSLPSSDFGIGAMIPNQLLACQQVPFDSFGLLSLDFSSFQWWQTQACGVLSFVQKAKMREHAGPRYT